MQVEPQVQRKHLAAVLVAWLVAIAILLTAGLATAETQLLESEVSVSGTAIFMNGDDDQFRQRHGLPPDFTGGVENLYLEWLWGDGGTIKLEGRGMVDYNDYVARLRIDQPDKGFVSAGYTEFRTWYDGTGGFFPQNAALFSFFDEDLRVDRGHAWLEAGLRLPDVPAITARYRHLFREGQKNSLTWGDTQLTGGFGSRGIVPSFWDVDEDRDIFDIDVEHGIRSTDVGLGFLYESSEIDNSRNVRRRPDEAQDRFFTQRDTVESDVYNVHAFTSTPFLDERLVLSTAYAYTNLDNDLGGTRIYGAGFNSAFDPTFAGRQPFDEGFVGLDGSTELRQHVGNFSLQGRPSEHLRATLAFRVEQEDIEGDSDFIETNVGTPPALAVTQEALAVDSEAETTSFAESLEVRYTGIENWVWYVRSEWEQQDGDLFEREIAVADSAVDLERDTDIDLRAQKYGVGAIWYPVKRVNASARYWYKLRDYDFDHDLDSTDNSAGNDRFPAFITSQEIATHAGELRLTWRVRSNVRLTGRYDVAYSDYDQRSEGLGEFSSAQVRTHAIGGNASWNPTPASYVQADLNYVNSETDTPGETLDGFADNLVADDFDNDYWTASLVSGVALTEKTDVRGQYFYYRADNYDDNSAFTQPYGSNASEHGFALTLGHRFTDNLRGRFGYAFFTNDEELAGGANDYDASLVTAAVDVQF